jgi:hypothetical protein
MEAASQLADARVLDRVQHSMKDPKTYGIGVQCPIYVDKARGYASVNCALGVADPNSRLRP